MSTHPSVTLVEAKVTFDATHHWPDAQWEPGVEYLQHPHRHLFVIRARASVSHDDRDREFILLGQQIRAWLEREFPLHELGRLSCEQLARMILDRWGLVRCSVHEDDENGAIVAAGDSR